MTWRTFWITEKGVWESHIHRENSGGLAHVSAPCECSIYTELTIEIKHNWYLNKLLTGDYWNVTVPIRADCSGSTRQQNYSMLNNSLSMRLLTHAKTHKSGNPLCLIWRSSIHEDQREKDWSSIRLDKTRSSTVCLWHESFPQLVILIKSSTPSPFTCFRYPVQSKEAMIYQAAF